jgi:hypothetical protein
MAVNQLVIFAVGQRQELFRGVILFRNGAHCVTSSIEDLSERPAPSRVTPRGDYTLRPSCYEHTISISLEYAAWRADVDGRDPGTAYRRYVQRGPKAPTENPFRDATQVWLLCSLEFAFGLGRADSVGKPTRCFDRALSDSDKLRQDTAAIRVELLKTAFRIRPLLDPLR